MSYIEHVETIANEDARELRRKDAEYGGSWLKRGGIGAYMMLARKWDRLSNQVEHNSNPILSPETHVPQFDILAHIAADQRPEGILDDIRDLRRYLILVEAEARERIARWPSRE